jgi:hypothetical protein
MLLILLMQLVPRTLSSAARAAAGGAAWTVRYSVDAVGAEGAAAGRGVGAGVLAGEGRHAVGLFAHVGLMRLLGRGGGGGTGKGVEFALLRLRGGISATFSQKSVYVVSLYGNYSGALMLEICVCVCRGDGGKRRVSAAGATSENVSAAWVGRFVCGGGGGWGWCACVLMST